MREAGRRVIQKLMTSELTVTYSFTGRASKKKVFKDTPLFEVARQALHLSMKCSDKDIEHSLQTVFRYAKDRVARRRHSRDE